MNQNQLAELRAYLLKHLGLHYTKKQEKELISKISLAAKGFDFSNTESFVQWLLNQKLNAKQTRTLASFLTIGETYFFRERKALDFLEFYYLPNLIYKRKKTNNKTLRIWSAGCSSGEEPYTLAILLTRILPNIESWDISILGTDINPNFLDKARTGVYSKWSFRGMTESFKKEYFDVVDETKYKIKPFIRKMVNFSYLNLAHPPYTPLKNKVDAFDVILCRNVLIYFSREGIKMVTKNFYNKLENGGLLLLSAVESSNLICEDFDRSIYEGLTIYEKNPEQNKTRQAAWNRISVLKTSQNTTKPTPKASYITNLRKEVFASRDLKPKPKKVLDKALDLNKLKALLSSTDINEVEKIVQQEIAKGKNQTGYYLLLAQIKANKREFDTAEQCCKKVIQLEKVNTEAYFLLANIYNEQGKIEEAVDAINKALFLDPNFSMAHFLLGNIKRNSYKNNEAIRHYNSALKSLSKLKEDEVVAGSDGLTAGRLSEMIKSVSNLQTKVY